jgi:hypothetical protein
MTGGISSGVWYFGIPSGCKDPPGICAIASAIPRFLNENSVSSVLPAVYFTNMRREIFILALDYRNNIKAQSDRCAMNRHPF